MTTTTKSSEYNVSVRYSWMNVDFGDTFDHEWLPLGESYTVRSWPTTWASRFNR